MMDEPLGFPHHGTIVKVDNLDAVRSRLPADQREMIVAGCVTWRMPDDVDTWSEPCGSTLSYWPQDSRGALCHDGDLNGSAWGTWRDGELLLDDGLAVDVHGCINRVWLSSAETDDPRLEPYPSPDRSSGSSHEALCPTIPKA